jgi:DNA-binding NarL/FixJ family response regulator
VLRILLADDHRLLRETLGAGLTEAGETVVGEAATGTEAIRLAAELEPDIVLIDLSMPELDGDAATRQIVANRPEVRVVVLTMHDDKYHHERALAAGAVACLTKDTSLDEILATIRAAAGAPSPKLNAGLSPRQLEILQSLASGRSTKETARDLGIAQKTIHNHLNSVKRVLGVPTATHAVVEAVRLGLVDLD